MKGIIFNIVERFILEKYGEDTFDSIIASCQLETTEPFVGPGTYSDNDMLEILRVTTNKLGIQTATILRLIGQYTFGQLANRYPNFVEPYDDAKKISNDCRWHYPCGSQKTISRNPITRISILR